MNHLKDAMKVSVLRSDTSSRCTAFTDRDTNIYIYTDICFNYSGLTNKSVHDVYWPGIVNSNSTEHGIWRNTLDGQLAHNLKTRLCRGASAGHTYAGDRTNDVAMSNDVKSTRKRCCKELGTSMK